MKLFKPNGTNITLFFAASIAAACSLPRLAEAELVTTKLPNQGSAASNANGNSGTGSSSKPGSSSATSSDQENNSHSNTPSSAESSTCPPYGCPLLPRDMYFDEEAQAALKAIRSLHEKYNTAPSSSSATVSGSGETTVNNPQDDNQTTPELHLKEALDLLKTAGGQDQATLTLIGYKGGNLEDQINQDRAFVISPFHIQNHEMGESDSTSLETVSSSSLSSSLGPRRLLGVFDGHAKLGELVSEYTVQHLPELLSSKLEPILAESDSTESDSSTSELIQQALVESFIQIDKTAPAHISGGCTASIVLQLGPKIYVANAGDSRSLIATYDKTTSQVKIVYITREDKPDLPEEKARVEKMGGQVYIPPPARLQNGASSRVLYVDPNTGTTNGLAMSRSIGDWDAAKKGVIPDPTVEILDITQLTENSNVEIFAVSATDGLLDFVDVDQIAETVAHSLYVEDGPHPLSACESLITTSASAWWKAKNGRYRDDIAIAVSKMSL